MVSLKYEPCYTWLQMSWFPIIAALGTSLFQCQFAVSQSYQAILAFFPALAQSLPSKGLCVIWLCEHITHLIGTKQI